MGRRVCVLLAAGLLAGVVSPVPAGAIVGGRDAAPGAYPAVAYVTLGSSFACTGTLIAPTVVLTAGHCGSLTGAVLATPIGWPPSAIKVTIGAQSPGGPGEDATVTSVRIPPSYLATTGSDVSLLVLSRPAAAAPVRIAGRGEEPLWAPGVPETIVGFGATSEGGPPPARLQQATVPVVADDTCAAAYGTFERGTMLCAGYPQGGTDTCQGDSGGPLLGRRTDGSPVIVGSTSQGDGCARPGRPGVYARVADTTLREWIRSQSPSAVDPDVSADAPAPAPAPAAPAPSAPALAAPTAGASLCTSRRTVVVSVRTVYRRRIRSAIVLVSGRRVATLRGGRRSARVSLAGRPRGRVSVRLVMRLRSGARVTDTRRYRICGG